MVRRVDSQIRALRGVIRDLPIRPGADEAMRMAEALLAFYQNEGRQVDYLVPGGRKRGPVR